MISMDLGHINGLTYPMNGNFDPDFEQVQNLRPALLPVHDVRNIAPRPKKQTIIIVLFVFFKGTVVLTFGEESESWRRKSSKKEITIWHMI